ncbi:hypothetical protein Cgig2_009395 [Carnegiea gigantea]|uniref:Protein FAR1-RELATED SEQUENCE n=1 Tax=Carnegiea gigantea TaxID=171969 RepID=A0A9Q1GM50_9CARY|nr:hypothetical protein Cgig2_009395 [Carnegiea gigantea]
MEDMKRFIFKTLDLGHEFYKKYAKVQGSRVREAGICKSRRDGHPTSTLFKCSAEGVRLAKHVDNTDRVRKAKDETRFDCKGMRSTQGVESMHRNIKSSMTANQKLHELVEAYDQAIIELRVQDGLGDFATIHTYPFIDRIFSTIKSHAAKIYTRECFYLLYKEMTYESIYIVKDLDSIEAHVGSPQSSPAKFQQKANTCELNPTRDVLMRHMPHIYTSGEMSQVEYSEEVEKFDKDSTIVDLYLKEDW